MPTARDIVEFDTKLTADVVEWRPVENSTTLACGTYFLDKERNQRLGCLYLLDYMSDKGQLTVTDEVGFNESGILDFKWLNQTLMLTIDSTNNVDLLEYDSETRKMSFKSKLSLGNDCIGLILDFIPENGSYRVLSSDTKGTLSLLDLSNNNLGVTKEIKAHDYEVWSVSMDRFDSNLLYSGADDCELRMWDVREPCAKPVGKCTEFAGGVTFIMQGQRNGELAEGYTQNELLCSSYDERIYVLDKRNLKRSLRSSKKMNGGVWKMKMHANKNLLLCACMHTGAHVVNSESLVSEFYYDKHGIDQLVYGCDWKPISSSQRGSTDIIATCSFYNHSLRLWELSYTE